MSPPRRGFCFRPSDRIESLEGRALLATVAPPAFERPPAGPPAEVAVPPVATLGRKFTQVVYTTRGGVPQRLDVYLPAGAPPAGGWPVVLAIHGGGWRRFSKEQYGPKVAAAMVPAGFAVVAPNYTLANQRAASWPLNADQLRDAVRWVARAAGTYGLDPSRIAAMGESAGGHLAAVLGTDPRTAPGGPRVRAVVSFFGPTDLEALALDSPTARPAVRGLLGIDPAADPRLARAASPVALASRGDAPALLIHGMADGLVPPEQSEALAAALGRVGVEARVILVPGATHGFGFGVGGRDLRPDVLAFLARALGTGGVAALA
jgi:acetyl esterase/lipase